LPAVLLDGFLGAVDLAFRFNDNARLAILAWAPRRLRACFDGFFWLSFFGTTCSGWFTG
jgi:hypothetical protein